MAELTISNKIEAVEVVTVGLSAFLTGTYSTYLLSKKHHFFYIARTLLLILILIFILLLFIFIP